MRGLFYCDTLRRMHRSVAFQFILGGFLLGVTGASFLVVPAWTLWTMIAIGLIGLTSWRPMILAIGCVLVGGALGAWRTQGVLERSSVLMQRAGQEVTLNGYVDGDVTSTKLGVQYPFFTSGERVLVSGPSGLRPRYGQVLSLTGKLKLPTNSGDFDYISYLAKDDIYTLINFPTYSVPRDFDLPLGTRIWVAIAGRLHAVRDALADSIGRAVPTPESSYLAGILVGAQGIVSPEVKDMFSRTGTSHILAISGYNITVVAGALLALLMPLGRRRAFWLTIAGIAAFTVMTGASASVVRAAIMGVLALVARHVGRQSRALGALLFAAALMTLYNPMLLRWDIGFQFSFLALIGIIYLEPMIPGPRVVATTLAASVMVLPLSLSYFGQLPVYTLPANILVLPLVPLAMALGLVTGIAGWVWSFAGQLVGQVAWFVAALQLGIVRLFAGLPYAAIEFHMPPSVACSIYAALAVGIISYYRKQTSNPSIHHD